MASYVDNFDYPDGSLEAVSGGNWSEVEQNVAVTSGQGNTTTNYGGAFPAFAARYESPLDSADHEASIVQTTRPSSPLFVGPAVRCDAASQQFYGLMVREASGIVSVRKSVDGQKTSLYEKDYAWNPHWPNKVTLRVEGDWLTGLIDDVPVVTLRDSDLTGGPYCGLIAHTSRSANGYFDDFSAADLNPPNLLLRRRLAAGGVA